MNESSGPGADTGHHAGRGAGGAPAALATAAFARAARWGRWGALLPVLACACSLEGLSAEWDSSSALGGAGDDGLLRSEAEDEGCELSGRFERVDDPEASGGIYVAVPEEASCNGDRVDCSFKVDEAGTYQIKARVATGPEESTDNSFLVRMDHAPELGTRYDFSGTEFHEDYVHDSKDNTGALLKFALDAGVHVVSFECREDAARLDWVQLVRIGP
ncbi:hypothetical protein WME90_25055 [Sorangium sp. So ce375]|uniref:hypothetical protein n=1 Tax=Sorangium sp. So ce375 TaxID=3133306 RepID=UPI003F5C675C